VVNAREHLASAGPAETAMFSGRGLKGRQIFFPKDFEPFGFSDQNGRKRRARHFSAVRTMTIGKHKQFAVYFILNGPAITAAFDHNSGSYSPTLTLLLLNIEANPLLRNWIVLAEIISTRPP
jgi:hypothetical protein